ncbi:unnamed protein product [Sphagnum balticum]
MTEISTVTSSGEYRGREGELADDDDAPHGVVAREMTVREFAMIPLSNSMASIPPIELTGKSDLCFRDQSSKASKSQLHVATMS